MFLEMDYVPVPTYLPTLYVFGNGLCTVPVPVGTELEIIFDSKTV